MSVKHERLVRDSVLLVSDSVLVATVSLCISDCPFTVSERQVTVTLKVHKREIFYGSDFEIFTFS